MALYFLHRTRILCNIIVLCAAVLKEYFMCYLNEILFFYHISCVNFCISYLPENHVNVLYEYQLEPRHEISNNVVCATCNGSNQPENLMLLLI